MIRRLHLLANPKGGVGDNVSLAREAEAFLEGHGVAVSRRMTEYAGHARELVEEMDCCPGDAIGGIGGDGTMHEMVNGMMQREETERVPLTLLPGGTGNSFLRDVECLDVQSVLQRIVSGARRSIDLLEVTVDEGRRYHGFNIVGWGLVSSANELAESLRILGRRRYDVATVLQLLRNRAYKARLEFDEEIVEGRFTMVSLSNTVHTGAGMRLAPEARLDDGQLDLIFVEKAPRRALLRLFASLMKGRHLGDPAVNYRQTAHVKLATDEDLPINLDGELIEGGSFEVRVLPGAMEVLI